MKPVLRLRLHATQAQPCFPAGANRAHEAPHPVSPASRDSRYNTLHFASKAVCQMGVLPPLEPPTRKGGTLPLHGAHTAFSCYPALRLYRLSKSPRGIDVVSLTLGISETEEIIPDDKIWLDLVVFKDADTAKKYVPDKVIDWEMITKELENVLNNPDPDIIEKVKSLIPELLTNENKFNTRLFKDKYLDYFMNRHIPGTEYKEEFKKLADFIYDYTGASELFTGSGVTVSARGLENIERGFTKYKEYNIAAMRDYKNIKIFRFEVHNDTLKKIKRVYVREVK